MLVICIMNNDKISIEKIEYDSNGKEITVSTLETREEEDEKKEEDIISSMSILKVTLDKVDIEEGLSEIETINKHLQVIYDNQKNILNKLSEIKKDHDYDIKWVTDEVNFLVKEHSKRINNIV